MTREQKMNKRREEGKTYTYKPNPFTKGTREYFEEQLKRSQKNVSHKTHFAKMRSLEAKLDNMIFREKIEKKREKEQSEKEQKNGI